MGWQQGAIADSSSMGLICDQLYRCGRDDLVDTLASGLACVLAVSQTCDIVQFRNEAEPYVEFVLAHVVDGPPNPADMYQKSFRTLAIPLEGQDRHLQVKPWNRFLVPRELVTKIAPSTQLVLTPQRVRDLMDWLVTRYVRAALPDEFNRRLGTVKAEDKLRKFLEKLPAVTEVFIALRPRHAELQVGDAYTCDVALLCREAVFVDSKLLVQMQPVIDEIEKLLDGTDGVDVEAVRLIGEHQFTRHHMRVYDRWQFDDVSYAADVRAEKKGLAESGHDFREGVGRSKPPN